MTNKKKHSLRINLAAGWVEHAIGMSIGIFLMPFVLHTLGDEQYGAWLFINSIAGYSGLLYLGFGQTICRYVATYSARKEWQPLNEIVSIIFGVYLTMGGIAMLIAGGLAWFAQDIAELAGQSTFEMRVVVLLLGFNVAASMVGSVFGGVLMGIQRFAVYRAIGVTSALIRLMLIVLLLQAPSGLVTLAAIFTVVTIFENASYMGFAFYHVRTLSVRIRHVSWSRFKEYSSFSSYSFLNVISFHVLNSTDTVIIGVMFGAKAIVPYAIALRLSRLICRPITQIGGVFLPRAGELQATAETKKLRNLVTKGVSFSFALTAAFFIGAGFFGGLLIETWVGAGYEASHLLLMVLLGAQLIAVPAEILRSILFGIGQVRLPAVLFVVEAVANVVLTLLLIKPLGLMGVALGTMIPVVVVELGILLPYAVRKLQLDTGELIRQALGPLVLPLGALLAYSFCLTSAFKPETGWVTMIAVSAGGGVILAGVWLACQKVSARHPLPEPSQS